MEVKNEMKKDGINPQTARQVYSSDLDRIIDRTTQLHKVGLFDVDFKDSESPNPQAREWTYGFSCKTLRSAKKGKARLHREVGSETLETRIVKSDTGEVIGD